MTVIGISSNQLKTSLIASKTIEKLHDPTNALWKLKNLKMTDYVLGQVAAVIAKPNTAEKENKELAALFTVKTKPKEPEKENIKKSEKVTEKEKVSEKEKKPVKKKRHIEEVKKLKEKKKKKNKDVEDKSESVKKLRKDDEKTENEPGSVKTLGEEGEETVHWSKLTGAARRVASKVASKESKKHNTSKDHRTIFIGNLPLSLAHKTKLKKLFSKYGPIESLRFRCPPTKNLTTSKRVAVIKKEFHPGRDNMIAYVCYKEEFSAEKALYMNGKELDGHHLRVDISTSNQKANHNKSIFVGNLPINIGEDDVREIFKVCGDIDNVRIIRDNKTGLGKGFCYVAFKKKDHVELALKLDGTELKKRELRVKRCMRDRPNKDKKDNERYSQSSQSFRPQGRFNQPSNSVKHSFQGMKAKRSLKDKMKKKKFPRMSSSTSGKQRHPRKDSKDFKNSKTKEFSSSNKAHKRFN